jgi:two-component system sensor histidine kinase KdpD
VRWSPEPDSVSIEAGVVPPDLELRIVDHGPGVPVGERDRVLLPFQRLDDRGAGGVGLGLAIAHGFVDAMGGELLIDETPGGGATFRLLLAEAVP